VTTVRLSSRLAFGLLVLMAACNGPSPTEPASSAPQGDSGAKAATAGKPRRPAPRVVAPRASGQSALEGAWGGDHVGLTATGNGVAIEFDCAAGSIDGPFTTAADGRFALDGSFWFTPSVLPEGWQPDKRPARYSGVVENGVMTLTVSLLEGSRFLGRFTLVSGQTPRIVRCV
jgi:hypothetical protein